MIPQNTIFLFLTNQLVHLLAHEWCIYIYIGWGVISTSEKVRHLKEIVQERNKFKEHKLQEELGEGKKQMWQVTKVNPLSASPEMTPKCWVEYRVYKCTNI